LCSLLDQELDAIQALIREAGPGPVAGELWALAVSTSDNLSDLLRKKSTLRSIKARQTSSLENHQASNLEPTKADQTL
jgi:hypothetical protein